MTNSIRFLPVLALLLTVAAFGQGQDSHTADRDLQVLRVLLSGGYDNANQSYFDVRGKRDIRHRRIHLDVEKIDAPEIGEYVFHARSYWDNDRAVNAGQYLWVLSADHERGAVRMKSWSFDELPEKSGRLGMATLAGKASCDLHWRREAEQFRATLEESCDAAVIDEMVLGEKQLWLTLANKEAADYKLHRVREFGCYADIPGVGGGRPEPYERYDDFKIHDQGGAVWFTSKEGRKLGISLFLVDWPINNYEGIFTRDSFVIYVSEEIDGERKEHGYAFTVPEADRIGINLKWILASCFMKSNKFATPYM